MKQSLFCLVTLYNCTNQDYKKVLGFLNTDGRGSEILKSSEVMGFFLLEIPNDEILKSLKKVVFNDKYAIETIQPGMVSALKEMLKK